MAKKKAGSSKHVDAVRRIALSFPETTEGTSCNNAAFQAGGKNFVFLGDKGETWDVMLKLGESYPEAELLGSKHPDTYRPGKGGWVKVVYQRDETPPKGLLERWIDESFRLLAPKTIVSSLADAGTKTRAKRKAGGKGPSAKRKTAKKKSPARKKTSTKKKASRARR